MSFNDEDFARKWGLAGTAPIDNFGGYKNPWPDGEDADALAAIWSGGGTIPAHAAEFDPGRRFTNDAPFTPRWVRYLSGHRWHDPDSRYYEDIFHFLQLVVPQLVRHRQSSVQVGEVLDRPNVRREASETDFKAYLVSERDLDKIGFILDTDSSISADFQKAAYREAFNTMTQPRLNWWRPGEVAYLHGFPGADQEFLKSPFSTGDSRTDERYFSWQTPVPIGMTVERWARLNVEHAIASAAERGEVLCCDRASVDWDQPSASSFNDGVSTKDWRDRKRHALSPGCAVYLVRSGAIFTAMALCEENAAKTRREAADFGIGLIAVPPLGSPFLH